MVGVVAATAAVGGGSMFTYPLATHNCIITSLSMIHLHGQGY